MGYLVIKNGTNKKSYQLTNTCNKPRLRVGNSYVPITSATKPTMRARISGSYIADYKPYTYTGNKGTVTTGTTYLTRTETTGTTYQTRSSTSNAVYGSSTIILTNYVYTHSFSHRGDYFTTVTITVHVPYATTNGITHGEHVLPSDIILNPGASTTFSSYLTYRIQSDWSTGYHANYTYTVTLIKSFVSGSGNQYGQSTWIEQSISYVGGFYVPQTEAYISITGTTYQTRASTYNTLYGTRASTSGTSYGTKTTNKTLTSSSWG